MAANSAAASFPFCFSLKTNGADWPWIEENKAVVGEGGGVGGCWSRLYMAGARYSRDGPVNDVILFQFDDLALGKERKKVKRINRRDRQ